MRRLKILYVEDDDNLAFVVKDTLLENEYDIHHVNDGLEASKIINGDEFYDLYIFDIMLPNVDGYTLAKELRMSDKSSPILFLTAKGQEKDKIEGFEAGGDDYITKPFSIKELLLRIQAILKRTTNAFNEKKEEYEFGNYIFNVNNHQLRYGDELYNLTKKEAGILEILSINMNKTVHREEVLQQVWGNDNYFNGRSMDVYISKLRKYLKSDPRCEIATVHGVGFRLEVNESDNSE